MHATYALDLACSSTWSGFSLRPVGSNVGWMIGQMCPVGCIFDTPALKVLIGTIFQVVLKQLTQSQRNQAELNVFFTRRY